MSQGRRSPDRRDKFGISGLKESFPEIMVIYRI